MDPANKTSCKAASAYQNCNRGTDRNWRIKHVSVLTVVFSFLLAIPSIQARVLHDATKTRGVSYDAPIAQVVADNMASIEFVTQWKPVFAFVLFLLVWLSPAVIPARWRYDWQAPIRLILTGMICWQFVGQEWTVLAFILIVAGFLNYLAIKFKKLIQRRAFLLGLSFSLLSFFFAMNGVLQEQQFQGKKIGLAELSIAAYEASQALALNMESHSEPDKPISELQADASGSEVVNSGSVDVIAQPALISRETHLLLARIFAMLFALFVAYQSVSYFCRSALQWARLNWLRFRFVSPRPHLICGLGFIGLQLVRELRQKHEEVIVVEQNPDNTKIGLARDLGAIVIVADATDSETLQGIPLNAVDDIFVVAGTEEVNIAIVVNLRDQFLHGLWFPERDDDNSGWGAISYGFRWIVVRFCLLWNFLIFKNGNSKCYVQVHEPDMQRVLLRSFHHNRTAKADIEFFPFNSDQNAVRDLILEDLTPLRPTAEDEVALYIIVGFDPPWMWREIALGLAHLAHFENGKRSRMLILTKNPNLDSKVFLSQYPKFTIPNPCHKRWDQDFFKDEFDNWVDKHEGASQSDEEPLGVTFATHSIFSTLPASANDDDFMEFIRGLFESKNDGGNTTVKPVMIVADLDDKKGFAWANTFAEHWHRFRARAGLMPPSYEGDGLADLSLFVWLPGQQAMRSIINEGDSQEKETRCPGVFRSFGDPQESASLQVIKNRLQDSVAKIVGKSYSDSREIEPPDATSVNTNIPPVTSPTLVDRDAEADSGRANKKQSTPASSQKFDNQRSDMFAADHALIKLAMAAGKFDLSRIRQNIADINLKTIVPAEFSLGGTAFKSPTSHASPQIEKISRAEHHRWCAESLLRNCQYVTQEPLKVTDVSGKRVRKSEHQHLRQTLCSWARLLQNKQLKNEKLKDTLQVYYVLYYLSQGLGNEFSNGTTTGDAEPRSRSGTGIET